MHKTRKQQREAALWLLLGGLMILLSSCGSQPVPPDQRPGWISRETREAVVPVQQLQDGDVETYLQVESPDWRDQVVYFIMTDRFDDGVPANSDQGEGEYDPGKNSHYSGGDLKGISDNIDYIKGLGATSIWITPPVANQWYDYAVNYGGYHGYWAENFQELDVHMGTLDEYRELSALLHKNGMYLIQDIVTNHTGNFFTYDGPSSRSNPARGYVANENFVPRNIPSQYPFNLNDPNDPEALETAAYHWTGPIANYNVQKQVFNNQLSDLDDINTENELVRDVLRESYGHWIREAGVDGYRIDTVKYIPVEFFHDFHYSEDDDAPGILNVADELGKSDFITFGEAWIGSSPYNDEADQKIAEYLGTEEEPAMPSLLNFTLNQEIREVFGSGAPTDRLAYRMEASYRNYPDPNRLFTFIDNHDMDRFLSIAGYADMQLALAYIFTAPGIPVVYYGTEQHFDETRQAMFANGFASGGEDHFNAQSRAYDYISRLAELRSEYSALRRGVYRNLGASSSGPGLLAYAMDAEERQDQDLIVLMNSANYNYLVSDLETGLNGAHQLTAVFSAGMEDSGDITSGLNSDASGRISLVLPPKSLVVFEDRGAVQETAVRSGSISIESMDEGTVLTQDTPVSGTARGVSELQLVVDGNLDRAIDLNSQGSSWSGVIPAERYANGPHSITIVGRDAEGSLLSSPALDVTIDLAFSFALRAEDEVGDDAGPAGEYIYPLDESFNNQMDIEAVEIHRAGTNLRLDIFPAGPISTVWQPANGFDHVYYYVYFDNPAREGATELPFQNASMPDGSDWDVMMMVGGWNASLYSAEGAGAESYGTAISSAIEIDVDEEAGRLSFTIEGAGLGNPESLDGMGIYITTWDYDGLESANRLLQAEPDAYIFGGGDFETDPLIMDDLPLIRLGTQE